MPFAKHAFLPDPSRASFNERMNAVRSMVEITLQADGQIARDSYLQQISLLLGVAARCDPQRSDRTLNGAGSPSHREPRGAPVLAQPDSHTKGEEEHLLYCCLHQEPFLQQLSSHLPARMDRYAHYRRATAGPRWPRCNTTAGAALNRSEALHENEEEKALAATMLLGAPGEEDWTRSRTRVCVTYEAIPWSRREQQIELEIASKGATVIRPYRPLETARRVYPSALQSTGDSRWLRGEAAHTKLAPFRRGHPNSVSRAAMPAAPSPPKAAKNTARSRPRPSSGQAVDRSQQGRTHSGAQRAARRGPPTP